jgi:hypothetical protein
VNHRLSIENTLDGTKTGGFKYSRDKHGRSLLMVHAVSGVEVS